MRIQLLMTACVSALLANVANASASVQDGRPRVAVVNAVEFPASIPEVGAKLRDTLNEAVKEHGYDLAPDAGACIDRACLKAMAVKSGATDVLIAVGGQNALHGYHVELRIWNVSSDRDDRSTAECNVCTADQIVETVSSSVGHLLDRVPVLHVSLPPPSAPVANVAPPPSVAITVPPPAHQPELLTGKLILGGSLAVLGIAGIVTGSVYLHEDGEQTNCESVCRSVYNTRTLGISVLAGGLVAGGIGGWLLWSALTTHDTTVAVGPSSIAIAGRF